MEKGEIARYEKFFLFTQYFQKDFTAYKQKQGLVSERVKSLPTTELWTEPNWKHLQTTIYLG